MFLIHMHRLSCQIGCQNNGNKDGRDQAFIVRVLGYFALMACHCQEKPQGNVPFKADKSTQEKGLRL